MPPTYCPCPRPILKRASHSTALSIHDSQHIADDAQLLSIDPSVLTPLVRFSPSQSLCHTFLAHSPAIYDRSPIVVSPNRCKLPERGCPGRTYLPGDDDLAEHERRSQRRTHSPARRPAARAWLDHAPPALVPDLSSSSDESDGFASPPLETVSMDCYASAKPALATSTPSVVALSLAIPSALSISPPTVPNMTNPTSPVSFRSRSLTAACSRRERSRSPATADSIPAATPAADRDRRRRSATRSRAPADAPSRRYKAFSDYDDHSAVLASCRFAESSCLDGF